MRLDPSKAMSLHVSTSDFNAFTPVVEVVALITLCLYVSP